jgi:hypothetical protein
MVGAAGRAQWKPRLRHNQAAFDDSRGDAVQRAEAAVPLGGCVINGHDVTFRELLETDEIGHEAGGEGVAPTARRVDERDRGGGMGTGKDRMRGQNCHQGGAREEQLDNDRVVGHREGDHAIGGRAIAKGRGDKGPAVDRQVAAVK